MKLNRRRVRQLKYFEPQVFAQCVSSLCGFNESTSACPNDFALIVPNLLSRVDFTSNLRPRHYRLCRPGLPKLNVAGESSLYGRDVCS